MVVWGHDLLPARTLVATRKCRTASSEFGRFADRYGVPSLQEYGHVSAESYTVTYTRQRGGLELLLPQGHPFRLVSFFRNTPNHQLSGL